MRFAVSMIVALFLAQSVQAKTIFLDTGDVISDPVTAFHSGNFTDTGFRFAVTEDQYEPGAYPDPEDVNLSYITDTTFGGTYALALTITREDGGWFDLKSLNIPTIIPSVVSRLFYCEGSGDEDFCDYVAGAWIVAPAVKLIGETSKGAITAILDGFTNPSNVGEVDSFFESPVMSAEPNNLVSGFTRLSSLTITTSRLGREANPCDAYNVNMFRPLGTRGVGKDVVKQFCDGALDIGKFRLETGVEGSGDFDTAYVLKGITVAAVPLPATGLMLIAGIGALAAKRRRKTA